MSANNYILINRTNLEVTLRDADTGKMLKTVGKAESLNDAIDTAQQLQQSEPIEYGIQFTDKK